MGEAITCPSCKRAYAWKPELAGKTVKCKCGGRVDFPEESAPPDVSKCPNCSASLPAQVLFCVRCGFNRQTGAITAAAAGAGAPAVAPRAARPWMIGVGIAILVSTAGAGGYYLFRPSKPQEPPHGKRAAPAVHLPVAPQPMAIASPALPSPLRIEDLLAQFPAKIAALAPKGSQVNIAGRVHSKPLVNPDGSSHVALITPYQADEDNTHVTCLFDKGTRANLSGLASGDFVAIAGTAGEPDLPNHRLVLEHCTALTKQSRPAPSEQDFQGHWRGILQGCPTSAMDLVLTGDHKAMAYYRSEDCGPGVAGTWTAQARADAKGSVHVSGTLTFTGAEKPVAVDAKRADSTRIPGIIISKDSLEVPPVPPLFSFGPRETAIFYRQAGQFIALDPEAPEDAAVAWMQANIDFPDSKKVIDDMTKAMKRADDAGQQFSILLGAKLVRSHRVTRLETLNGQLFTFEYTDDQTARSGLDVAGCKVNVAPLIASPMAGCIGTQHMAPEAVIESVDLGAEPLIAGKDAEAKVSVRAIHLSTPDRYAMAMNCLGAASTSFVASGPDLDATTWKVAIPLQVTQQGSPALPLTLYFTLMRQEPNFGMCSISKTVGVLVDVRPP